MMKAEQLIEGLLEKGIRFEAYSNIESRETFIGATTQKHVWDWFVGYNSYFGYKPAEILADHSYSQNTGRTVKSLRRRMQLQERYSKILNVTSWYN